MRQLVKLLYILITGLLPAVSAFFTPFTRAEEQNNGAGPAMIYGDKSFVSLAVGPDLPLRGAPAVVTAATPLETILETVPGLCVMQSIVLNMSIYPKRGVQCSTTAGAISLVERDTQSGFGQISRSQASLALGHVPDFSACGALFVNMLTISLWGADPCSCSSVTSCKRSA